MAGERESGEGEAGQLTFELCNINLQQTLRCAGTKPISDIRCFITNFFFFMQVTIKCEYVKYLYLNKYV